MLEFKKCKGNGVTKGCGCNELVPVSLYNKPNRKYGLGISCGCYSKWLTTSEEGKLKIAKSALKVSTPRKEFEKAKKEKKERKTLSKELKKTQDIVNAYVRKRDIGKPCISQNTPWSKDFDAGHCYPVGNGKHSAIRFDLDNIHGQSVKANRYLSGDEINYISNLPNRIGKERAEALKNRADECKKSIKKWTAHSLLNT